MAKQQKREDFEAVIRMRKLALGVSGATPSVSADRRLPDEELIRLFELQGLRQSY